VAAGIDHIAIDDSRPHAGDQTVNMFDTVGKADGGERKENTVRKLERMNTALRHDEPDRVPISDFFWGSFIERWRRELGLPADTNPYYHYDLDWITRAAYIKWAAQEANSYQ
jgi:hypothetical protein